MNKKIILRIIYAISTILICISIFNFSNQDGNESGGKSKTIANFVVNIVEKIRQNEFENREEAVNKVDHIIRKLAHFSIYTLLGISIMCFMCTFEIKIKYKVLTSLGLGLIYACSDELHQMFIPGREGKITDILLDTSGVLFGILIIYFLVKITSKKMKKIF